MKIVYVCEWGQIGGVDTVLNNLIHSILKMKYNIDIHIVSFGQKNEVFQENGCTIHLIKKPQSLIMNFWSLKKLLNNKILEINPDLIHLHLSYPPYSFVTELPIPVITTVHGLTNIRVKGAYSRLAYLNFIFIINPYFEKKALKKSSQVIAVSEWIKENVNSIIGLNSKTIYIPNGINFEKYDTKECVKEILHPSVFFMGRLVKAKGADILIKSLAIIKKTIPDIHLYMTGEGCQYKRLKRLVTNLDLVKNVTFLGFISESEKIKILHSVDILVVPSRTEPFGIVTLEALAAGTPIVATKVGGIPQVLNNGEYGILVEPDNPYELAQGILLLFQNSNLRAKLVKSGKERAKQYSWDEITKKTVELYFSTLL